MSLYKKGGKYASVNYQGMAAFFIPVALTITAITTGYIQWFYKYGWFTGSILGAVIYFALRRQDIVKSQE